ncbi:hypothetical protein Q3G72_027038 [Acer saccharum]|nr:hypothetical protein Q3G72_027038 [Acer saccharum]
MLVAHRDAITAEILAIHKAVSIVLSNSAWHDKKVVFASDSLEVVNWINSGEVGCLAFVDQIFEIRNWLRIIQNSSCCFHSRSTNSLADSLARQGSGNNGDYVRFIDS